MADEKPEEILNHPDGETFIVRAQNYAHGLADGTFKEFQRGEEVILKLTDEAKNEFVRLRGWLVPKKVVEDAKAAGTPVQLAPVVKIPSIPGDAGHNVGAVPAVPETTVETAPVSATDPPTDPAATGDLVTPKVATLPSEQ
jgi:hypothetical protein